MQAPGTVRWGDSRTIQCPGGGVPFDLTTGEIFRVQADEPRVWCVGLQCDDTADAILLSMILFLGVGSVMTPVTHLFPLNLLPGPTFNPAGFGLFGLWGSPFFAAQSISGQARLQSGGIATARGVTISLWCAPQYPVGNFR